MCFARINERLPLVKKILSHHEVRWKVDSLDTLYNNTNCSKTHILEAKSRLLKQLYEIHKTVGEKKRTLVKSNC